MSDSSKMTQNKQLIAKLENMLADTILQSSEFEDSEKLVKKAEEKIYRAAAILQDAASDMEAAEEFSKEIEEQEADCGGRIARRTKPC